MSTVTLSGKPYPKQIEFFKSTKRYIAYGGSRGGGKSWAARRKAVLLALNYSGIQILILRRTLAELRENHVLVLQAELKGIAKYDAQNKEFLFPNESRIKLGYCSAESDVLQYQGQAYDIIMLEESTQFTEFQKDTLTESNRSSGQMREKFTPRMYFTCNPGGIGHSWMKRLFIDKDYRNKENPDNYEFIPSTVYENKYLMTNNPEYVENLENLPEMRKRAMLYGDWDAFEGQYFDEFDRDVHVIEPFIIPNDWRRYITLDYGLDMLACYWIAVDTHQKAYVYKELYQSGLVVSDAVEEIKRINGTDTVHQHFAPPDLWNRQNQTGKSTMELFGNEGIRLVKADNSRIQGWYNVKEWLKPYSDEQGIPTASLVFFRNCTNIIRTLPQLQGDPRDPNDVDSTSNHELSHGPDAIRYFIAGRPRPAVVQQKKKKSALWMFESKQRESNGVMMW